MTTLDSLSRNELRALCQATMDLLGEDAVARLVPAGPFDLASDTAQLALTAVDGAAIRSDLYDWLNVIVAVARCAQSDWRPLAADGASAALRETTADRLSEIASRATAALDFDVRIGIGLSSEVISVTRRALEAQTAYDCNADGALDVGAVAKGLAPLCEGLRVALCTAPFDDDTAERLVAICDDLDVLNGHPAPWSLLGTALRVSPAERVPLVRRLLERNSLQSWTRPALQQVGAFIDDAAVAESLIQSAELFASHDTEILHLLVTTLRQMGRDDQARYWDGRLG
ncbi:MAG: hypothetical protein ACI81R_001811 [Bradymonadia bacterium]|jgi:hypothetical protein